MHEHNSLKIHISAGQEERRLWIIINPTYTHDTMIWELPRSQTTAAPLDSHPSDWGNF